MKGLSSGELLTQMEQDKQVFKSSENSQIDNSPNHAFFLPEGVVSSGSNPLEIIFQTLLLQKKVRQQDLADFLSKDKSYISKICHGKQIPDLTTRLKIASFFQVDSCLIWRNQDIDFIRKVKKFQMKVKEVCQNEI